jgi:DNA-binding transcriptional regulator GbsR (MarR family)
MQLNEAKTKFIEMWGTVGSEWGISRSKAQIHALLLLAERPMTADEIMADLQIARGNANTNIRHLIDWGLVKKELVAGERKEFFVAYKDMWVIAKQVMIHRKRRELEPLLRTLAEIHHVEGGNADEIKNFEAITGDIRQFADRADRMLNTMIQADQNWLGSTFMSLLK